MAAVTAKNTALTFAAYTTAPRIIGVIFLSGDRVLGVNLDGSRELDVSLQGAINVTKINQNFTMVAGDTKRVIITVTGVDLTGASVKWALKKNVYSASNDVFKSTAYGGVSITDAVNGKFTVSLAPTDTVSLKPGDYYHEAEVTDSAGNVSTVTTGKVTISPTGI